jgi:hypothetical protein
MTEKHSKPRQQAEIAFAKAQSQFLARGRAGADTDPVARAREDKTLRLKKARLAKELEASEKVAAPLLLNQIKKA